MKQLFCITILSFWMTQLAFSQMIQSQITNKTLTTIYYNTNWTQPFPNTLHGLTSVGDYQTIYAIILDFTIPDELKGQIIDSAYIQFNASNSNIVVKLIPAQNTTWFPSSTPESSWNIKQYADLNPDTDWNYLYYGLPYPKDYSCLVTSGKQTGDLKDKFLKNQLTNGIPKGTCFRFFVCADGYYPSYQIESPSTYTLHLTTHSAGWQYNSDAYFYGNVGIGTSTPAQQLHVKGNTYFENGNVSIGTTAQSTNKLEVNGNAIIQSNLISNSFTTKGQMLIKQDLTVKKGIKAKEIMLKAKIVPDFVFDTTYKLMPINDLDTFISTHKHLPQIATEKEMLKNGVEMSAFQMQLLQKIEELSLYLIEQNKQIDSLNKELEELKKKEKH